MTYAQDLANRLGDWDQSLWFAIAALTVFVTQGALVVGFVVQRAARRRAQAALQVSQSALRSRDQHVQTLAGRLIAAQEQERARIARELHDDLSQKLALLSIDLRQLVGQTGVSNLLTRRVQSAAMSLDEIATAVHSLSRQLHPARLEMLGLEPALRSLCRDMSAAHNLRIEFEHEQFSEPIPYEAALCLFRVTQEALRNVVKHSVSPVAQVRLSHADGALQLHVADSGRGFLRRAAEGGLGLVSMRERVHFAGGQMTLQSIPGQGTRIDVRVPVSRKGIEFAGSRRAFDIPESSWPGSARVQDPFRTQLVC
ncbi:MAG TPA: sensor histidine kinase [Vicinamibacterales bacterium]|nr:sensor histidine kinase [Vicinamibacterales bacterium]